MIPQELIVQISHEGNVLASISTGTQQFVRIVKKLHQNTDEEGNQRPVLLEDILRYIGETIYKTGENYKTQVKEHDAQLLTVCLGLTNNNPDLAVSKFKQIVQALNDPEDSRTEQQVIDDIFANE